jgi:hypothetical protein
MSLERRLAKLEQAEAGDGGAGVLGVCRVDDVSGTGPDVVTVAATGATMTKATFRERYPSGLLVERMEYGTPSGSERPGDDREAG